MDQNYHHAAMKRITPHGAEQRRGRPDIAHISLLMALGSPLNREGNLKCYVHTVGDKIITVNPKTRLPRQTDRFVSLLEQLFLNGVVPKTGEPLLALKDGRVSDFLRSLESEYVVALSTEGAPKPMSEVARAMSSRKDPVLLVGGFPSGHFSKESLALASDVYQIYSQGLDAWTVVARAIYDYEKATETKTNREQPR